MKKAIKAAVALSLGLGAGVYLMGGAPASMQTTQNQNQNQNGNSNRSQNTNSNRRSSNMNGNMNGGMMNSNMGGAMNTMGDMSGALDTEFARAAAMGGQAEIQMAQLALQRSTNREVQNYARRMIKDHTKAGKDLMKTAAKKNMMLPTTPSPEQMQMMTPLQQASGAEFDQMYMQMAGVMSHQMMLGLYQNQAQNGTDPDLKKYASKTLPVVQAHLRLAERVQGTMNGGSNVNSMNMNRNSNGNMNSNTNSNKR